MTEEADNFLSFITETKTKEDQPGGTQKTLTELLDLSLRTPEIGAVNFNILHRLLSHILQHIGLAEKVTVIEKDLPLPRFGPDVINLEKKVLILEDQIGVLNEYPTNEDVFAQSKAETAINPAATAWQTIQIRKRIETNESGVTKSLGLIDEILKEINIIQKFQIKLKEEIDATNTKLDESISLNEKRHLEYLAMFENHDNEIRAINDFIEELPPIEEFAQFVTWPVVSQALLQKPENHTHASDKEKKKKQRPSRKKSGHNSSRSSSRSHRSTSLQRQNKKKENFFDFQKRINLQLKRRCKDRTSEKSINY